VAIRNQSAEGDTWTRILDAAERLVQTRGFNAFSYADVASELAITKPALHYHFASKAELGEALIHRYAARFEGALEHIDQTAPNARAKLTSYVELYGQVLAQNRMCLCGMLAAESDTLSDAMRSAVVAFFDHNESWLANVLDEGRQDHTLHVTASIRDTAQMIIGSLEGAMLVARTYHDTARFTATADCLLAEFTRTPAAE
jgi:TetR/AcrR family transcriptional regulator, transcriptional repressor for nem operon